MLSLAMHCNCTMDHDFTHTHTLTHTYRYRRPTVESQQVLCSVDLRGASVRESFAQ